MSNWIDRAKQAYQDRLEQIDAQNKAQTARLIKAASGFLGEEITPIDVSIPGRITVDENGKWMIFQFADTEEQSLQVIHECSMCGKESSIPVDSMADLGYYLAVGNPDHDKVCANQQKA